MESNWVWPIPEPLFVSSRYCLHDMFRVKVEMIEPNNFILIGPDEKHHGFDVCVMKTDIEKFIDCENNIQHWGSQFFNRYMPYIGEICLINHNNFWYRCEFLDKGEDGCLVYAIDYGTAFYCDEDNIRVHIHDLPYVQTF